MKLTYLLKGVLALGVLAFCAGAHGQLRTVTLGITTHCPYGVGGCWAEIRNGLDLPEAIAAFPQRPDTKTQTFDLHMREDWRPDPNLFARNFKVMNVGVDVRGVEATVDGMLGMEGTNLVLRVNGAGVAMRLAPLTRMVQWDTKQKRPQTPTRAERKAFEKLAAQFKKQPVRVRVVGPILQEGAASTDKPARHMLEVRKFEVLKESA